jgi:hypothetical protein
MTSKALMTLGAALLVVAGMACSKATTQKSAPGTTNTTPAAMVLPTYGPGVSYHPVYAAADFSANVDNPWFPLKPGTKFIYIGTKDGRSAREVFNPTSRIKMIEGVPCRVVDDKLYLDGKLAEDTLDYYTQDRGGNVWYFGEETKSIDENGKVDTSGTWMTGVNGAWPGVYMEAVPQIGHLFRQEWYKGEAEDQFKVVSLTDHIAVLYGSFDAAQRTEESTTLEPEILDNKYYVRGVGQVMEVQVKGPPPIEKLELKEIQ